MNFACHLEDEMATVQFGGRLARAIAQSGAIIYLEGDLGAGKTTLSRGIVQGFGHVGAVKSPTYTLVEPYTMAGKQVYHFDLYRLTSPDELDFMGLEDYFAEPAALCLVEWPARGAGSIPAPDLVLELADMGSTSDYQSAGRSLQCRAMTDRGQHIVYNLIELSEA